MPIHRRTVRRGPALAVAFVALSVAGFGPTVRAFAQDAAPQAGTVEQDPPSRVGYVSLIEGTVSMRVTSTDPNAGDAQWAPASINYPMSTGTSLWTEPGAKAEIQIGAAHIDLDGGTEVDIVAVDDQNVDINVPQGRADIHLHGRQPNENYEATLPRGTAALMVDGTYRLIAGDDQNPTRVGALYGTVQLLEPSQTVPVETNNELIVTSGDPLQYTQGPLQDDAFDHWVADRMHRFDQPAPHQYVSPQVVGAQALDQYGTWQQTPQYGAVWIPAQVSADWAPYREGHWRWVAPWGWTWVDDEPWGFAPFHYGRWAQFDGRWGWVPGTVVARPVYAPAMVAFVGGAPGVAVGVGIGAGIGISIGWVPLGPGEVYRPPYHVSDNYYRNVNVTNVSNTTIINRTVNVTNVTYANQRAVTVVNHDAFVNARPVRAAALPAAQAAAFTHPIAAAPGGRGGPAGGALPQPTAASRVGAEAAAHPVQAPPKPQLQMPQTHATAQGRIVPTAVPAAPAAVRPGAAPAAPPTARGPAQPGAAVPHPAAPQPNAVAQPHAPNQPAVAAPRPGPQPGAAPPPRPAAQPQAAAPHPQPQAQPPARPQPQAQPAARPQPQAQPRPAPQAAQPRPQAAPQARPQPQAQPPRPQPAKPAPAPHPEEKKKDEHPAAFHGGRGDGPNDKRA